jgi:hypothetical protein
MTRPAEKYKVEAMRIYRCKLQYLSGLLDEPAPSWPHDYESPEDMVQQGTGKEALQDAFRQCHAAGRDMQVGDVVGLDDGSLHRCEASGWSDIGKTWTARVQQDQERVRSVAKR